MRRFSMGVCRTVVVLTLTLLVPLQAAAAPAGKVVIAQGVDPTTLDAMNQQETPASVVAEHIYNKLVERDPSLKIVPALAAELPKLISPQVWEIKLRRGVKFHNGEDFNADPLKCSLTRAKDPSKRGEYSYKLFARVSIVTAATELVNPR